MNRLPELFLTVAMFILGVYAIAFPEKAKAHNVQSRTIYANLPVWFFRGIGIATIFGTALIAYQAFSN